MSGGYLVKITISLKTSFKIVWSSVFFPKLTFKIAINHNFMSKQIHMENHRIASPGFFMLV